MSLKKFNFVVFLILKHSSPMESALELIYVQNHTIFTVAESTVFNAFVCQLRIAAVLAVCDLQCCKHDLRKQKVKVCTCHCAFTVHKHTHCFVMVTFDLHTKSLSIHHPVAHDR